MTTRFGVASANYCGSMYTSGAYPHHTKPTDLQLELVQELKNLQPWLKVIGLQELFESDSVFLERELRQRDPAFRLLFVPTHAVQPGADAYGIAIATSFPVDHYEVIPLGPWGDGWDLEHDLQLHGSAMQTIVQKVVLQLPDGSTLTVTNIWYAWTPDGRFSTSQAMALPKLIQATIDADIALGDYNLPRDLDGEVGEGWYVLSQIFQDNIPAGQDTTLEDSLHYASHELGIKRVVDFIWTRLLKSRVEVLWVKFLKEKSDHLIPYAEVEVK